MLLLNPQNYAREHADLLSKEIMLKTITFFETKGLAAIKNDDQNMTWYQDVLDFVRDEGTFATLLTPAGYGAPDSRFDLRRVCEYNEILAFYSLAYQYAYQVTILGLGPIWMGSNEEIKHKTAQLLQQGGIFAFGLSEREHGADLYSTETTLFPDGAGAYRARGRKYYIGNGNAAAIVSTFGKMAETGEFVFFGVNPEHESYELVRKIDTSGARPSYVAEYALHDYPITESDIMSQGQLAWDSSLNTVNIGKFQLGFATIGICEHAFFEAINHASQRVLYSQRVTDFTHVQRMFTESYARLVAAKLFALRATDYFRSASDADRRYLLFNPVQKMKVTSQGIRIIDTLLDIIAAKGFEQETYFEMAIRDIGMIPRLEGTEHVNMALVIKFMRNYFFDPAPYPCIAKRDDPADDAYLFDQKTGGLARIKFPDHGLAYDGVDIANAGVFQEQIEAFKKFLIQTVPTEEQKNDIDYNLAVGELFTMIVYAQLCLEATRIYQVESDLLDEIFNFVVRDFSHYALELLSKFINTTDQERILRQMILKPVINAAQSRRVWQDYVLSSSGQYV